MKYDHRLISGMMAAISALCLCGCQTNDAEHETNVMNPIQETVLESDEYIEPTQNLSEIQKNRYRYAYEGSLIGWNVHQDEDAQIMTAYTQMSLWELVPNVYDGRYHWSCEMAKELPEDVTASYAGQKNWSVPSDATEGYAWKITLNPEAVWEDGSKINADSYVYALSQALDPQMKNNNAKDFYETLPIAGAKAYALQNEILVKKPVCDINTGVFSEYENHSLYISFTQPSYAFYGRSGKDYYEGYEEFYVNEAGENLLDKYGNEDYIPVNDQVIEDINAMLMKWYDESKEKPEMYLDLAFYDAQMDPVSFDTVGVEKNKEYELTIILDEPLSQHEFMEKCGSLGLVNETLYEACKKTEEEKIQSTYATSVDTYMSFGPYKLVSYDQEKGFELTKNEAWYGWKNERYKNLYKTTDLTCQFVKTKDEIKDLFANGEIDFWKADQIDTSSNMNAYSCPEPATGILCVNSDSKMLLEKDTKEVNKSILSIEAFRKGLMFAIDKEQFAKEIDDNTMECLGLINDYYLSDADTGKTYRKTVDAKNVIDDFYPKNESNQRVVVDSKKGGAYMLEAYEQLLKKDLVDVKTKFVFDYLTWQSGEQAQKEVDLLQKMVDQAIKGTDLEGRIQIQILECVDKDKAYINQAYDLCLREFDSAIEHPEDILDCMKKDISKQMSLSEAEKTILETYQFIPLYSRYSTWVFSDRIHWQARQIYPKVGLGGIRMMDYATIVDKTNTEN